MNKFKEVSQLNSNDSFWLSTEFQLICGWSAVPDSSMHTTYSRAHLKNYVRIQGYKSDNCLIEFYVIKHPDFMNVNFGGYSNEATQFSY